MWNYIYNQTNMPKKKYNIDIEKGSNNPWTLTNNHNIEI